MGQDIYYASCTGLVRHIRGSLEHKFVLEHVSS